jgi:hypothetical protein
MTAVLRRHSLCSSSRIALTFHFNCATVQKKQEEKAENPQRRMPYMLRNVVDTTEIKPEDFARIKEKWRSFLVGDESNHADEPSIRTLLDTITQKAQDSLCAMNRAPDAPVLFGTEPVVETHDMGVQYGHL